MTRIGQYLALVIVLAAAPATARDYEYRYRGCAIRSVHVTFTGPGSAVDEFVFVLEEQLQRYGFVLADDPAQADATLEGSLRLSDRVYGNEQSIKTVTAAYVSAKLKKNGRELWRGYFKPKRHSPFSRKNALEYRAAALAKDLAKKCEKGF